MIENNFETMELAVKEQVEELARVNEEIRNLVAGLKLLENKIDSFADKLSNTEVNGPPITEDTGPANTAHAGPTAVSCKTAVIGPV